MERKVNRRTFLKYCAAGVIGAAVAGTAVYFGTQLAIPKRKEKYVIGMMSRLNVPFWFIVERGAQAASRKYGFALTVFHPTDLTSVDQIKVVRAWVAQGIDGIAWAVNDPEACKPVINEIVAKGIPVITFNGDSPESDRLLFLDISHEEAVYLGIKLLAEGIEKLGLGGPEKPAKIVFMIGDLISGVAKDMRRGAERAYKEIPWLKEVQVLVDDGSPAKASTMLEELLVKEPDLVGIYAAYDYDVPAAGEVITKKGLIGKVVITGTALTGADVPYILNGAVYGVADNRPYDQGFMATEIVYRMLTEGVEKVAKELIPKWPEEKIYRPPPIVYDKEKMIKRAKEDPEWWKAIGAPPLEELLH
jgi:ABC-type sugar transport system substrate-binding protein